MTTITKRTTRARRVLAASIASLVALPLAGLTVGAALAPPAQAHEGHAETEPFDALVFSKTAAFRHGSIEAGIAAIEQLGADHGFTVDATEDASAFNDENLADYEVVIWLSTTGDVLDDEQQAAFERYIQNGGGYAGIHAASDTEYDWPWYGELVGAYFDGHPPGTPDATVKVDDHAHPSTQHLPGLWDRTDEWYNFAPNPRGDVHVLASLDETSYNGGSMGNEHPVSWCRDYDGGRSWYTGMGHTDASFAEVEFLDHILGGIRTAAGVQSADCGATLQGSFEKITLDNNTANPMELAVASDGRVVYVDRNGEVRVITPDGAVSSAGEIDVYTGQEFGLLGVALDPDFDDNGWVYLYHSPAGEESVDRVSRFTMEGNTLDMGSEVEVIEIPVQRDECCHAGGSLEFDHHGNLYIATGDNTNPFDSGGYAPIDERDGRASWDAQRTSANTNSLNGKVLRITPLDEGGYEIPEGNLFAEGTDLTRPEIYGMGFRNPFRIGLDEQTGGILVADYGPDAGAANPDRGPDGRVEWNILSEPGNYGWPYCVSDNTPYNDFDFASQTSGPVFDCAAPINDSPNNTGLEELPPAIPADMWQGKASTGNPEIGGSGAPMTSGTYAYDEESESNRKWPAYFDGKAIWADWNNSRLFEVQMNEDHTEVIDVSRLLPELDMTRPHALQFGPDGALYMIEWGSGFNGNNTDSGIYRIDYVSGNRAPVALATADQTSGPAPLTVQFDGSESHDPDGTALTFAWDFDGDGTVDSTEQSGTHTYEEVGDYTARLTVTDEGERTSVTNIEIVVGNTAPEVELVAPVDGGFFDFGDTMDYRVVVSDVEDGDIDCEDVVVQPALGHDEHAHGYGRYYGCEGTIPLPGDEGHVGANIFGTITATYTDGGADGVSELTTQDTVVLHTKHKEAEYFDQTGRLADSTSDGDPGVTTEQTEDPQGGGQNIGFVEPGDWIAWDVMNLTNINAIALRAAAPEDVGATWEVRSGAEDGPVVATIEVPNTGGWQAYETVATDVVGDHTESGPLYFVQVAGASNVNWIEFRGRGVTENRRPDVTATADVTSGPSPLEVSFDAEATDEDGDTPIEFSWVFGDGGTAEGASPTHTYTAPGEYDARVTATDSRGATSTRTIRITVQEDLPSCFNGRSDDFLGDELDVDRWDSSVRVNDELTMSDGQLHMPVTATDIYGSGGTPTPNIVLQHLPGGGFTITTKVTAEVDQSYQQAGLIIYGDDDNYMKLSLQGRSSEPDRASNIIQFASEIAASPTETNSPGLGEDFPSTVWLRLTSDNGLDVTASYSANGQDYVEVNGSRSLDGINEPRMGMFALSNLETEPVTAHFDYFMITPDDTATPCEPGDGPVVETTLSPDAPTGANGWYQGPVSVSATATGGSGDAEIEQRVDGGDWSSYSEAVVVEEDGEHTVEFRATDADDNVSEIATVSVKIDATAPTARVAGLRNGAKLNVAAQRKIRVPAQDDGSGVAKRVVRLNGKVLSQPFVIDAIPLQAGRHRLVVRVKDDAGNVAVQRRQFRVVANYPGGRKLIRRLHREDRFAKGPAKRSLKHLNRAHRADRRGNERKARRHLRSVANLAGRASDRQARSALKDLSRELRRQL